MKRIIPLLLATLAATAAFAGDYPRVIFSDDFSGNTFGPRWGHYKSGSVVKDGVLVGITPEGSDHSAVDNIKFPGERDLEVSVKFRFVSDKAKSFNVWFDDKDYKGSHAGHICQASISPNRRDPLRRQDRRLRPHGRPLRPQEGEPAHRRGKDDARHQDQKPSDQ